MLVETESIKTFEKAMADFKEALAKYENLCYEAAIVANSASTHLLNLAMLMKAKAEKGEKAADLLAQAISYIKKKYQETIAEYSRIVLSKYYLLLLTAKSIARDTATREQKAELEKLKIDIDAYEDERERINTKLTELLSDIAQKYIPEHTSPAQYADIADSIIGYLQGKDISSLKEDMDVLGTRIKRQIEIRFIELINMSEKILAAAKSIEEITQ